MWARLGPMMLVEAVGPAEQRVLRVYEVPPLSARSRGEVTLQASLTDEITLTGSSSSVLPATVAAMEEGGFALFSGAFGELVDIVRPRFVWTPLTTMVLQDATGLRALILPVSGVALAPLASGTYRLQSSLNRSRWQTSDPPSDLNGYTRSATVQFSF
jgi:hypothetical protein